MTKNDSNLPQRASIRLPGYDYTQPGTYFVTLCTQGREALFGEIVDGEMRLNAAGQAVRTEWERLGRQFPHLRLDAFVVMPNHVHGIIVINDVGATRRGPIEARMGEGGSPVTGQDTDVGATRRVPSRQAVDDGGSPGETQTDRTPRATLDNENETVSGANMGQTDSGIDQYGSPLRDAPNGWETCPGLIEARLGEGGSPDETQTNRTPRATLDNDNETIPGENRGQNNTRPDRYGSPLRNGSDVGATRRGPINTPVVEAGSPDNQNQRPNGPVAGSLGAIIGQFKSRTTRRIRSIPGYEQIPVWQRNYFEHIIRNEVEWGMITEYIKNNPERWEQDRLNLIAPENPLMQGKTNGE